MSPRRPPRLRRTDYPLVSTRALSSCVEPENIAPDLLSMSVERELEMSGRWWFPGREGDSVPGRLLYSAEDGGYLELIGSLESLELPDAQRKPWERGVYPLIHGEAGGWPITLLDSFQLSRGSPFSSGPERVRVGQVLKDYRFDPDDTVGGTGLSASMRHLTHWVHRTGLEDGEVDGERRVESGGMRRRWATVNVELLPTLEVDLPDGGSLKIFQSLKLEGDGFTARTAEQRFTARVDFGGLVELEAMLATLSDFRHLVSIGAGAPAVLDHVQLWRPDHVDRGMRLPIDVHAQWSDWSPTGKSIHPSTMPFSLKSVGGAAELERWMKVARTHRRALARVAASRYWKGMVVSDRLLNRCAALESFDRVRTGYNQSKFQGRMRRCVDYVGEPAEELIGDVGEWQAQIKTERDDVAHHFGADLETDGARLLFLGDSVYWLFVMCMLKAAELPAALASVAQHRELHWLRPRLHHALDIG